MVSNSTMSYQFIESGARCIGEENKKIQKIHLFAMMINIPFHFLQCSMAALPRVQSSSCNQKPMVGNTSWLCISGGERMLVWWLYETSSSEAACHWIRGLAQRWTKCEPPELGGFELQYQHLSSLTMLPRSNESCGPIISRRLYVFLFSSHFFSQINNGSHHPLPPPF